jgi:hypothetical protein
MPQRSAAVWWLRIPPVHFVDLTRRALLASTFRTRTVRFVDLTNPATVTSTKCTLDHPYQSPRAADPTPSMPQFLQRRHTPATNRLRDP